MTDLRIRGDVDLPLPNPPNQNATRRDPVPGHAGLLLDKLSARLVLQEGVRKLDKTETLCRLFGCDIHERNGERTCLPRRHRTLDADAVKALKAAHERLDRLRVAPRGDACTFAATSPLVVGMGALSPLENGLTIHTVYGVPFIPGSALKGAARAWVSDWCGCAPDEIERLFGREPAADGSGGAIGAVTFLDALPLVPGTETQVFMADVMTPHAGPYYATSGAPAGTMSTLPPADWHSPNPIAFVAAPPGLKFRVRYLIGERHRRSAAGRDALRADIRQILIDLLDHLGIGAKTAAGYGRMGPA